jgi:hypothetical protein
MNYYSIALCFMLWVGNLQANEFVTFDKAEVHKTTQNHMVTVTLSFEILEGYHIQSEADTLDDVIATTIGFEDSDAYEIVSYAFTLKHNDIVVLNEFAHDVLINRFEVSISLRISENTVGNAHMLSGQLQYQACTDRQCLFPRTLKFQVPNI